MNRRNFLLTSAQAGALTLLNPSFSSAAAAPFPSLVALKDVIREPVIIESITVQKVNGELFILAKGANGLTGITMANGRLGNLVSIFNKMVAPYFTGRDAREIGEMVELIYRDDRNYKYSGMPFSNCVGHAEIAVFDLLGKTAGKPVHTFFGKQVRSSVDVYLSSLTRDTTPEQEADYLKERLEATGAKAVKIKVGGRMKYDEASRKRTEKLVPHIRKVLGDNITIYADGNSSFDVPTGIQVGKLLQDYGVAIFEEPCAWEDVQSNQRVAKALKIMLAGGEQDSSLYRWKFLIDNTVYDLYQPDVYYNGGIIRMIKVAEMAAAVSRSVAPHSPKADPLAAPFLHGVSVLPNLYGFQEYPADVRPEKLPSWYSPHVLVKNGSMSVPTGPGLGIEFDEDMWKKAELVTG